MCGVVKNHRDHYHSDRPGGHGPSLSSDSDLRQLKHGKSAFRVARTLVSPSIPFASTPETSEVSDPQSNAKILFQ